MNKNVFLCHKEQFKLGYFNWQSKNWATFKRSDGVKDEQF